MGNTGSQALPQDVVDAAMDGDARKVCAFLDAGGDIDAQSTIGQTLLNFATYGHGSPRVHLARELLARGADPNLAGDAGGTPLQRDDDLPRTPIPHRRAGRSRVEGPLVLARG